jgi:hypothetical protein
MADPAFVADESSTRVPTARLGVDTPRARLVALTVHLSAVALRVGTDRPRHRSEFSSTQPPDLTLERGRAHMA